MMRLFPISHICQTIYRRVRFLDAYKLWSDCLRGSGSSTSKEDTLQTHLHIWKTFQKHNVANLVMKTSVVAVLGLLAIVVTLGVNVVGAHAQTLRAGCHGGDRVYVVSSGD